LLVNVTGRSQTVNAPSAILTFFEVGWNHDFELIFDGRVHGSIIHWLEVSVLGSLRIV